MAAVEERHFSYSDWRELELVVPFDCSCDSEIQTRVLVVAEQDTK